MDVETGAAHWHLQRSSRCSSPWSAVTRCRARSAIRTTRQRELHRLGSDRLSRRPHDGDQQDQALGTKPKPNHKSGTTTRCSTRRPREPARTEITPMATRLKETDVVIIGLGAAGGGALPLAEPASRWSPRSRHVAHAARLRAGRDSQQRSRLAAVGAEAQHEVRRIGECVRATTRQQSSDDERGRRHDAALLAQSWRLNPWTSSRQRDEAAVRRRDPDRIHRRGLPFGLDELEPYYEKIEYEVGVSAKRQHQRQDRSGRQHFRGPRQREYPMRRCAARVPRQDGRRREDARLHPFHGPAAINSRCIRTDPRACITVLQQGGCHVDAKNARTSPRSPSGEDDI